MKRFTLFVLFVFFIVNFTSELSGQGIVQNTTFFSNSLQMERNVQIYLPEGYNNQDILNYPVIYFLHAFGMDHTYFPELFDVLDSLIESKSISPVIVVKPDGSNPPYPGSFYTNSELYGNFEDYIVDDLIEYIDANYRTISSREKRSIVGHSMGGFGSMKLAIKHQDKYCSVASHSGFLDFSHIPNFIPLVLSENGGAPVKEYVYSADRFGTLFFYTLSGAFSPNLNNPPYYVDFPLDSMGTLIDSVFNKWILHDPARLARNIIPGSDLAIYFDCGREDEYMFYPLSVSFADTLNKLGIDHKFQSFTGNHIDHFAERLKISISFLDSVMNKIEPVEITENWETKAPMPTARSWFSSSAVNNNIYAVGGATALGSNLDELEVFDLSTNTWTIKERMPTPRGFLSTCAVGGIIYTIGGGWDNVYSKVETYDPLTNVWDTKAPMLTPRSGLSVIEYDGIIYAIGGFNDLSGTGLTTVEAYNPQTNQWTTKSSMLTGRMAISTCVVDGIIYVFGGLTRRGSASLRTVEAYDPITDTWTTKTSMLETRAGLSTAVVNNIIYVFGGVHYGGGEVISTMEKYNPATDKWSTMEDMPVALAYPSCSTVNGKIYLIGGFNSERESFNTVYEYTPPPISNIDPGNVSGTWTKANSPYYINGEITIPNDSTLTIEPGVEVIFTGHYKFNVKGRLLAKGTENDTILFTVNDTTGFHHLTLPDGGWHGIKILDVASSNDSTIFEYCTFEYGKSNTGSGIVNRSGGAINTNLDKLRISHCLFRYNKSYSTDTWEGTSGAVLIGGNGIIEYSEFCFNESSWGSAMSIADNKSAIIRNNHFHHNVGHGTVNICVYAHPTFINNIIEYNHNYGEPSAPNDGHGSLHFSNNAGYAKIINNTIVNNTNVGKGGGVFVRDGNPVFINNIVYGNKPSQVNFLWASSVGFYNCLIEGGRDGFTGATFTGTYENCIDADPLFVGSDDYHLQNTSPCIGAGIDSILIGSQWYYSPTNCYYGGNRPNPLGSMPDIGACEHELDMPTDIDIDEILVPTKFALEQNYPNPFNPTTSIKYSIPKLSFVTIKIYDVLGSEVATLVNEEKSVGTYELNWNAINLPSGVYFYRLKTGNFIETKKMIMLR